MVTRREWLRVAIGGAAVAVATGAAPAFAEDPATPITVYKSPSCGCCGKWVEHLKANGFAPSVRDMDDLSEVKATFGVPKALQSCHTATVGRYVVEGHVPADLIHRMLREKAKFAGLAVPGMVTGSPGMEGGRAEAYDVVAFDRSGHTSVYAHR